MHLFYTVSFQFWTIPSFYSVSFKFWTISSFILQGFDMGDHHHHLNWFFSFYIVSSQFWTIPSFYSVRSKNCIRTKYYVHIVFVLKNEPNSSQGENQKFPNLIFEFFHRGIASKVVQMFQNWDPNINLSNYTFTFKMSRITRNMVSF